MFNGNNNNKDKDQGKTNVCSFEEGYVDEPYYNAPINENKKNKLPKLPSIVVPEGSFSEYELLSPSSTVNSSLPDTVVPAEILSFFTCLSRIFSMLMRNALTYTATTLVDFFVVLTLSHCLPSSDAFGGVATAMTITSLTSTSLTLGLSSALDTLLSVQYGKDPRNPVIAEYFRVSVLCNFITFLPMGVFYIFCPISFIEWLFPAGNNEMHLAIKTWLLWCPFMITPILISSALEKFVICQHKAIFASRSATVTVMTICCTLYLAASSVFYSVQGDSFAKEMEIKKSLEAPDALAAEVFKFVIAIGSAKWCGMLFLVGQIIVLGKIESNAHKRQKYQNRLDEHEELCEVESVPTEDEYIFELLKNRHPIESEPIGIPLIRAHFLTAIGFYSSYHGPEKKDRGDSFVDLKNNTFMNKNKKKSKTRGVIKSLRRFMTLASTYWIMAAPSLVSFSLDLWTLEVITILAARCGPVEVATWNLSMHSTNPLFSIAIATSVTAAVFVGNEEGKRFHIFDVDDEDVDEVKSDKKKKLKFPSTFQYTSPLGEPTDMMIPTESTSLIALVNTDNGNMKDDEENTEIITNYSSMDPTKGAFTHHEFHHRSLDQQAQIHQNNAKMYARAVVFLSSIIGIFVGLLVYIVWGNLNLFRHISSGLLTEKALHTHKFNSNISNNITSKSTVIQTVNPVADLGESLMPYFAIFLAFDMPFYSIQGIFRGYARLKTMMVLVFIALWMVAIPVAVTLSATVIDVLCLRIFTGALVLGCITGITGFLIVLRYHKQI